MPAFLRAMHTPSNAWIRSRVPSTTFTFTFTVSPGENAGMFVVSAKLRDLVALDLLQQVHDFVS